MMKVLIVEDEEMIRKGIILTIDWQALDCTIVGEAANGLEGLEAVERLHPDLIITDIRMPQMDGIEMMQRLRQAGDNTHVIILSAYDTFSYAQSALRLGAVDYLLKPFHDGELEQAVTQVRQKLPSREQKEFPAVREGPKTKYVREAMEFIRLHYNDPDISVGTVADHLDISEGYLSHTFKKETGLSPLNYLTQYRIHRAMELLRDCRLRVYEVAEKVGYQDIAYFSSTFKKLTGQSPSDFQNRQ